MTLHFCQNQYRSPDSIYILGSLLGQEGQPHRAILHCTGAVVTTYRLVRRDAGGHGALRAAVAGEGSAGDLNLFGIRTISPAIGRGLDNTQRFGDSESGKEVGDGETHFG